MVTRTLQLVIQYDGARFAGWQRQPAERTVQGVLEDALKRLCGAHVAVLGAGRTDAGVHALGQAAGVRVSERWTVTELRRAMNAVLPDDVWIRESYLMRDEFHARYSARSRSYRYLVGLDADAESPFRRRRELAWKRGIDRGILDAATSLIVGSHCFRAFAVRGTAPEGDDHCCTVEQAAWQNRDGGLAFSITANRFLHHMVRFVVATLLDVAAGRRERTIIAHLLQAADNGGVSAPAPPYALYLERVEYPGELYLVDA